MGSGVESVEYLRSVLRDAVRRYGDRLLMVLETAIMISRKNGMEGKSSYGDFEYRQLVQELQRRGLRYNPSQLLRILEREYGIIVTTYHTSGQHWYRFKDLEAVERALRSLRGLEDRDLDPVVMMLRVQVRSLQPARIIEFLRKLAMKPRLSPRDIEKFQRFAFEILPRVVSLMQKLEDYDELEAEYTALREIVELAYDVSERVGGSAIDRGLERDGVLDIVPALDREL